MTIVCMYTVICCTIGGCENGRNIEHHIHADSTTCDLALLKRHCNYNGRLQHNHTVRLFYARQQPGGAACRAGTQSGLAGDPGGVRSYELHPSINTYEINSAREREKLRLVLLRVRRGAGWLGSTCAGACGVLPLVWRNSVQADSEQTVSQSGVQS